MSIAIGLATFIQDCTPGNLFTCMPRLFELMRAATFTDVDIQQAIAAVGAFPTQFQFR